MSEETVSTLVVVAITLLIGVLLGSIIGQGIGFRDCVVKQEQKQTTKQEER